MALAPSLIAQYTPATGGTFEQAYVVPGATAVTISTIIMHHDGTSTSTNAALIRIAADNSGTPTGVLANQLWNVNVGEDATVIVTTGITLQATGSIYVASTLGDVNFSFFGIVET